MVVGTHAQVPTIFYVTSVQKRRVLSMVTVTVCSIDYSLFVVTFVIDDDLLNGLVNDSLPSVSQSNASLYFLLHVITTSVLPLYSHFRGPFKEQQLPVLWRADYLFA